MILDCPQLTHKSVNSQLNKIAKSLNNIKTIVAQASELIYAPLDTEVYLEDALNLIETTSKALEELIVLFEPEAMEDVNKKTIALQAELGLMEFDFGKSQEAVQTYLSA